MRTPPENTRNNSATKDGVTTTDGAASDAATATDGAAIDAASAIDGATTTANDGATTAASTTTNNDAGPGALPEGRRKRTQVRLMFDRIAPRYDLLNRLLTLGLDRRWRRGALDAAAVGPGDTVLDLACGTGDLSEAALARGAHVLGVDFSGEMLRFARRRGIKAAFVQADALRLPLAAGGIDVLLCGFALRNFVSLEGALAEAARVLCPGGRMALLDVDRPRRRLLATLHSLYFDHVVPFVGARLSDRAAYRYLPASTSYLPGPDAFRALLEAQGFCDVERRGFLFDSAQLWVARRAETRNPQQASSSAPSHNAAHNPLRNPSHGAARNPSHNAVPDACADSPLASRSAPPHNAAPDACADSPPALHERMRALHLHDGSEA